MLSNLRGLSFILIPVLGLVSCTNKNSSNPAQADSWRLTEPELRETRDGKLVTRPLIKVKSESLSLNAEIVFAEHPAEKIYVTVTTTCQSAEDTVTKSLKLRNPRAIPVLSLLPKSIWMKLDLSQSERYSCQFLFTAKNSFGSTHEFMVPFQRLQGAEEVSRMQISRRSGDHAKEGSLFAKGDGTDVLLSSHAAMFQPVPLYAGGKDYETDLICNKSANHHAVRKNPFSLLVIEKLVNGTGDGTPNLAALRDAFTLQSCRLFIESQDEATGLSMVEISPRFKLKYELDKVQVTGSIELFADFDLRTLDIRLKDRPFGRLNLANLSLSPVAFRFPDPSPNNLKIQYVVATANVVAAFHAFPVDLQWRVTGFDRVWRENGMTVYEVAPGQTVTIHMGISTDVRCLLSHGWGSDGMIARRTAIAGFTYSYAQPMQLLQYVNWDPARPDLRGETVNRNPLASVVGEENGVLPGWIPAPRWHEVAAAAGKPKIFFRPDLFTDSPSQCAHGAVHPNPPPPEPIRD